MLKWAGVSGVIAHINKIMFWNKHDHQRFGKLNTSQGNYHDCDEEHSIPFDGIHRSSPKGKRKEPNNISHAVGQPNLVDRQATVEVEYS